MSVTSEFYKIPNHSYILKCDFNQVFAPCAATLRCPRLYFYSYPLTSYQSCGCRFSQNNANGFLMLTSLALLSPVFFFFFPICLLLPRIFIPSRQAFYIIPSPSTLSSACEQQGHDKHKLYCHCFPPDFDLAP